MSVRSSPLDAAEGCGHRRRDFIRGVGTGDGTLAAGGSGAIGPTETAAADDSDSCNDPQWFNIAYHTYNAGKWAYEKASKLPSSGYAKADVKDMEASNVHEESYQ